MSANQVIPDEAVDAAAREACFSTEGVRWWAASDRVRADYTRRAHAQRQHAANPTQDCGCGCNTNAAAPIPAEAVEAAKRVLLGYTGECVCHEGYSGRNLIDPDCRYHDVPPEVAREILEAAAPHLIPPRKPKPGEGDYAPSWNDRKRVAEVWQGKAPLPVEGLSERVYEALIEVAAWGYQQRVDEDL